MNAYCTSKSAVYMFSDCLRAELASSGVGLTTVCPGVVDTNIVRSAHRDSAELGARAEKNWARVEKVYVRRNYGPDKVAAAILSAVKRDKAIRPVTPEAYVTYGLSRVLPGALRSVARTKLV
jgi:NAD(P)-dependent dehydrogenase (short-subunit alcohol dehydrogenase family)